MCHDTAEVVASPGEWTRVARAVIASDRDQDGRIDFAEFAQLLGDLEAGMSKQELTIGFCEVDTDHDGLIDSVEFMEWWRSD